MKHTIKLLALLTLTFFSLAAQAETIMVTKTADTNDGACDTDCSLREAILKANLTADLDTIELNQEGPYSIDLGRMSIRAELTIKGTSTNPAVIDGTNNANRRFSNILTSNFSTTSAKKVNFENLTFQNFTDTSAGVLGITGDFSITLNHTSFLNNASTTSFSGGGAIVLNATTFGKGSINLLNGCVFENNTTAGTGGAIKSSKGLLISNISDAIPTAYNIFKNNKAALGGGAIYADTGYTFLAKMIFDGNESATDGGAINLENSSLLGGQIQFNNNKALHGGAFAFTQSTACLDVNTCLIPLNIDANQINFANNQASQGGALYIVDRQPSDYISIAQVSLNQISIIDNKAISMLNDGNPQGGGIYSNTPLAISYSTIVNNTVETTSTDPQGGGIYFTDITETAAIFKHNIFNQNNHNNSATNEIYMDNYASSYPDTIIHIVGLSVVGSDVVYSTETDVTTFVSDDAQVSVDPIILNGYKAGYLPTIAGLALDAAENTQCTNIDGLPLSYDQAGTAIPANNTKCDIGAFELNCAATQYYVDSDSDGYGAGESFYTCKTSPNFVTNNQDCDDNNINVLTPDSPETCDGEDNNCNGEYDEGLDTGDTDGDGVMNCAEEETCDGLDNDGNGTIDEGFSDNDTDGVADCVDTEECDGLDNDGDGAIDESFSDVDSDGLADCVDTVNNEEVDSGDTSGESDESDISEESDPSDEPEVSDDSETTSDPETSPTGTDTGNSQNPGDSNKAGGSSGGGCSLAPANSSFNLAFVMLWMPLMGIYFLKRKLG
ncbi:CSLREA domain-containing protein [bacterium]|nr:CSLREA domain-containing protein [bacterium]